MRENFLSNMIHLQSRIYYTIGLLKHFHKEDNDSPTTFSDLSEAMRQALFIFCDQVWITKFRKVLKFRRNRGLNVRSHIKDICIFLNKLAKNLAR